MEGEEIVKVNTKLTSNKTSYPWCVAVNSQGIIYMTDLISSYKLFSPTCKYIRHITVLVDDKQTRLRGLAIDNDVVFVRDCKSNFILKYHKNDEEIGRIWVNIKPWYLAFYQQWKQKGKMQRALLFFWNCLNEMLQRVSNNNLNTLWTYDPSLQEYSIKQKWYQ